MIVRPAQYQDALALAEILNEIIEIGGTTAYENPLEPDYFGRLIDNRNPKIFIHVAVGFGEILGVQWIEPYAPPEEHIGGISTFTKTGLVQKGIARQLFVTTLKSSRDAGYTLLNATIRADNTGGLAYYSRMGFQDYNVKQAVPLQDGTPIDRIRKRFKL